MRLIVGLLVSLGCAAQVPVIFDDDFTSDPDGALSTAPALFKLADNREITIIGMLADSANALAAPGLKVFANYYVRPTQIGAYQGSIACGNGCNTSAWLSSLVGQFNPGDTRANYTTCPTVYRSLLASAPSNVTIVETGIMTCLAALLNSPADSISALTGAQLIQAKVTKLVVQGGVNPSGTTFNFQADPADTAAVFSAWTTQNGYPPIWMIGDVNGTGTNAGPPTYALNTVNPSLWVAVQDSVAQRPVWDGLCVLYAARGLSFAGTTYFSDAGNGTQTVNATTGANSWSTGTASGHHYLVNVASALVLSDIFDGFAYGFGFSALPPYVSTGAMSRGSVSLKGSTTSK